MCNNIIKSADSGAVFTELVFCDGLFCSLPVRPFRKISVFLFTQFFQDISKMKGCEWCTDVETQNRTFEIIFAISFLENLVEGITPYFWVNTRLIKFSAFHSEAEQMLCFSCYTLSITVKLQWKNNSLCVNLLSLYSSTNISELSET